MAQNYNINCFDDNEDGKSDLQKMENNFECLRSNFSGSTETSPLTAGQLWFDTTNKLLKIRNTANDAWLGVMCGDSNQKVFVYKNTACDGWVLDSSVFDCLLALKTSSGSNSYNIAGGSLSGTWSIPNMTGDHNHQWKIIDSYVHYTYDVDGNQIGISSSSGGTTYLHSYGAVRGYIFDAWTKNYNNYVNLGNLWRPYAAVGTLQYLNI